MAQDMSPLLGPDILQKQYELEQNKKIADILMSQGMQQPQGQMVSGRYVAPSFFQYATPLLNAYLGTKMSNEIPKQAADLSTAQNAQIDRMFGIGGATPQQASQAALQGGAMQGSTGPTVANALRMNNVQQGTGSAYPLIGGNAQGTAAVFRTGGPTAYAKALADQLQQTSDMKNIAAAYPVGSPEYNNAMKQLADKTTLIAPISNAPGNALWDPVQKRYISSTPKDGVQMTYDPNGIATAVEVPEYGRISANIAGQEQRAKSAAEAGFKTTEVQTKPNSPSVLMTQEQIAQAAREGTPYAVKPDVLAERGSQLLSLAKEAEQYLPSASSGAIHSFFTDLAKAGGISTDASKADAQLNVISAALTSNVPRMEGPQGVMDVEMYKQAAANVGNSKLPFEDRMAAVKTVIDLNKKYSTGAEVDLNKSVVPKVGGYFLPKNQEEYNKLDSGSLYRTPTGEIRTKR